MKKVSLYKFTHVPLLKNDAQLKQNNEKKKGNHPNLLKNENHAQKGKKLKKKSCLVKPKKKKKAKQSTIKPMTRRIKNKK